MRAVQAHGAVELLRADARANVMRVVWVLARHADWTELVTRPTWAVLMDRTGLSRSTMAAWLAWLHRAGLLGTVTPGTVLRYRKGTACGLIDDGRGNEAAEYVLAIPATSDASGDGSRRALGEISRTPSSPPEEEKNSHPTRAHARTRETVSSKHRKSVFSDTGRWWPRTVTPATRRDQLAAAERACREDVTLRAVSTRHLRSLLRPVFVEGGTLADALYFVNHRADGTPWPYAGTPRYLPGWVRHRLSHWLDENGRLREGLQLPSQAAEAQAARQRAEQARTRQDRRAALDQRADATSAAMRARTILAGSSPEAARAMARRQLAAATSGSAPRARQARPSLAAPAVGEGLTARPALRLVESEEVFRRQVIDRHALQTTRWASEPGPDITADDPDAVAAELAWLISVTRPTTPDVIPGVH